MEDSLGPIKMVTPKELRRLLCSSTDPAQTIRQFQKDGALKVKGNEPAVQFLDMLGVERSQLYKTLMEDLKTHLKGVVAELDEPALQRLLEASFHLLGDEDLGEVAQLCLDRVATLPPGVCKAMVRSLSKRPRPPGVEGEEEGGDDDVDKTAQAVFAGLPLPLQRQVWEEDVELHIRKRRRRRSGRGRRRRRCPRTCCGRCCAAGTSR